MKKHTHKKKTRWSFLGMCLNNAFCMLCCRLMMRSLTHVCVRLLKYNLLNTITSQSTEGILASAFVANTHMLLLHDYAEDRFTSV